MLPQLALALLAGPACADGLSDATPLAEQVAAHYVVQARERYDDALDAAEALRAAVTDFLRAPDPARHAAAKQAWIEAHGVYSHAEVFRFGNPNVDAWEGRVNAWPMDEGLIDYVAADYRHHEGNPHALEDIIGAQRSPITDDLIAEYSSGTNPKEAPVATTTISDIETNVTRGYHAIEFLLWGQDLGNASHEPGQRPHTDYLPDADCTGGHCNRRRDYLAAATRLLQADLRFMILDWDPDARLYAATFAELPVAERLDRMIEGLGTLAYAELAAERVQVALLTSDQEEEQSCFSDTTHLAMAHNAASIASLYVGRHERRDGRVVSGPSLSDLVQRVDAELDARLRDQFARTTELTDALTALADAGQPFDVLIRADHAEGRGLLRELMASLAAEAESFEAVRALLPELAAL